MKSAVLTIRLDPELKRELDCAAERRGCSRSDFVREAVRRQVVLSNLEDLRRRILPFAEAAGYLTDENVFRDVS